MRGVDWDKKPQPSQAQEEANAAFVWRMQCQKEFADLLAHPGCDLAEATWRNERWIRAVRRERELDRLFKAAP